MELEFDQRKSINMNFAGRTGLQSCSKVRSILLNHLFLSLK
jgi:hypothetical protein